MPCYEPPDEDYGPAKVDKYVATLKEIEESCKRVFSPTAVPPWAHESKALAQQILDIIDIHWRTS